MVWIDWGGGPYLLARKQTTLARIFKQGVSLYRAIVEVAGNRDEKTFHEIPEAKKWCEEHVRDAMNDVLRELDMPGGVPTKGAVDIA